MSTKEEAIQAVDRHVEPKACFITQDSGSNTSWRPLGGTGCAHWVAHQIGIKGGVKGSSACMEGFILRVPDLVSTMHPVQLDNVVAGDIWTNDGLTHTGLVMSVQQENDKVVDMIIKHCSSGQHAVVENEWKKHFKGMGKFYRNTANTQARANGSDSKSRQAAFMERKIFA